ncbi:hypothetical protein HYALB_00007762 [Hymenoscyphus albidus]|uniref:Uncharacterized protein n=1 Tax=Hymenoscyphus albidus TaxID=595503 RepID=A0A9N9Q2P1_9HELO|nr:hypothetical protein HYALB_00007762 [Hymenoscyphus albidus]
MLLYLFGILSLVSIVLSYGKNEELETVLSSVKCKTKWTDEDGHGRILTKTDSKIITVDPGDDYVVTPTSTVYTTKTFTVTVTPTVATPQNYIYIGPTPLGPIDVTKRRDVEGVQPIDYEGKYVDKCLLKENCVGGGLVQPVGDVCRLLTPSFGIRTLFDCPADGGGPYNGITVTSGGAPISYSPIILDDKGTGKRFDA